MSGVRPSLLAALILLSLISFSTSVWGSRLQYSIAIEHNRYRNDYDMNPGSAVAVSLVVDDPVIRRIGLQFAYSRLPFYRGEVPGWGQPRYYRRRITWYGLAAVKPFSVPLGKVELVTTPGIGFAHQSTWHEVLYEPEPWEAYARDHYTPITSYFIYQVSTEIRARLFGGRFDLAFGGIVRHFAEASGWLGGHDPPLLGLGYGLLVRLRGSF